MRRLAYFLLAAASVMTVASCKSTSNAYKQAYEKAVEQDVANQTTLNEVPAEVVTNTVAATDVASVPVREEKVTVVSGDAAIRTYAVVCGSFSLKTNAEALKDRMINDGYPAIVVLNEAGKTFRVVFNSFDTKEEAVAARRDFMKRYPDNRDFQAAWILYKK